MGSPPSTVAADDLIGAAGGVDRLPGSPGPSHPPKGAEEATDGHSDEHGQAKPGSGPGSVDVGVEERLGQECRHEWSEASGENAQDATEDYGRDEAPAAGRQLLPRWLPTRRG
jgi:hypothetical protein